MHLVWFNGNYLTMTLDPDAVRQNASSRLVLEP